VVAKAEAAEARSALLSASEGCLGARVLEFKAGAGLLGAEPERFSHVDDLLGVDWSLNGRNGRKKVEGCDPRGANHGEVAH